MEITKEILSEAWKDFDGTCPFATIGVECSGNCMTVEECNDCHRSGEYRAQLSEEEKLAIGTMKEALLEIGKLRREKVKLENIISRDMHNKQLMYIADNKRLREEKAELLENIKYFVDRVEAGTIRSKTTYAIYKNLLGKYK